MRELRVDLGMHIAPAYGMMSSLGSGMHALSIPIRSAMPA